MAMQALNCKTQKKYNTSREHLAFCSTMYRKLEEDHKTFNFTEGKFGVEPSKETEEKEKSFWD